MKLTFCVLVKEGCFHKLAELDGVEIFSPGQRKSINYPSIRIDEYYFLYTTVASSDGLQAVFLLPEGQDTTNHIKAYQKLHKAARSDKALVDKEPWLLKPQTLKALNKTRPTLTAIVKDEEDVIRCPHQFAGDSTPESMADIDYEPSDEDVDANEVPTLEKVVIDEVQIKG